MFSTADVVKVDACRGIEISIGRVRSANYYLVMRVEVGVPMPALRQDVSSMDSSGALRAGESRTGE
jgi:hypothetical protein